MKTEVDVNLIIQKLINKIGELNLQIALLESELEILSEESED